MEERATGATGEKSETVEGLKSEIGIRVAHVSHFL
jgi:hypothetical protein